MTSFNDSLVVKKIFFLIALFFIVHISQASIVITNGLTHQYTVKEGDVYKGVITIENTSEIAQNVKLLQKDYRYNSDDTSYYDDPTNYERSNSKWIRLNTDLLKIEAKGKATVTYEVTIPKNIPNGSSWSVIMVEPVDDLKPDDKSPASVQLKSVIRYAIQIITTNEKPAEALLVFDKVDLTKKNGKRILELDISNKGELFHLAEASIEIFDRKDGQNKGVYKSSIVSLLPDNSKRFSIDLSEVPIGKYNAVILVSSNDEHVFGINSELEVANE